MGCGDDCTDVGDTSASERNWALASEQPGARSTSSMTVFIVPSSKKAALALAIVLLLVIIWRIIHSLRAILLWQKDS